MAQEKHLKYYSNNHNDFFMKRIIIHIKISNSNIVHCSAYIILYSSNKKKIYTTKTQRDTKCVEEY